MDLRRQLSVLRAWAWLIVGCTLLAGLAAYAVSGVMPKVYEARATLIVGQSLTAANPDYNQILASQRLSTTYASVVKTRPLVQAVIDKLKLPLTVEQVIGAVDAQAPANNTLVYITVSDTDAQRAAATANALAEQLRIASPAIRGQNSKVQAFVDQQITATQQAIQEASAEAETLSTLGSRTADQEARLSIVQGRLVTLRSTFAALVAQSSGDSSSMLSIIEPAVVPAAPSSPRTLLNVLLALVLGMLAALGLAYLSDYLDDSFKGPEELTAALDLPSLGIVPVIAGAAKKEPLYRLVTILYPRSPAAESFRTLRTNIEFANLDSQFRTLLVTSAAPGEGKTTVAANIAVAFAQGGKAVLLVDCDLRRPSVHQVFNTTNEAGLTTVLRGEIDLDKAVKTTEQLNLWVLSAGALPPNPAELLGSRRMAIVREQMKNLVDIVIMDSPPLQAVTDAAVLAASADATLLVVRGGKTRQAVVRQGRDALAKTGGRVIGFALNALKARSGEDATYYHYYGSSDERKKSSDQAPIAVESAPHSGRISGGARAVREAIREARD